VSRMSNLNVILAMDVHTRVSLFISLSILTRPSLLIKITILIYLPFQDTLPLILNPLLFAIPTMTGNKPGRFSIIMRIMRVL